jgi:hypothetical protein
MTDSILKYPIPQKTEEQLRVFIARRTVDWFNTGVSTGEDFADEIVRYLKEIFDEGGLCLCVR